MYDEKEVFSLHDANDHAKLPLRDPFGQPAADAAHQLRRRQVCPLPGRAVYRHHRHLRHRIGDGANGNHLEHFRSSGDPGADPDRRPGCDYHSLFRYDSAAQADGHWQPAAAAGCLQPQQLIRHRAVRPKGYAGHIPGRRHRCPAVYDGFRAGIWLKGHLDLGVHRHFRLLQCGHRHHR